MPLLSRIVIVPYGLLHVAHCFIAIDVMAVAGFASTGVGLVRAFERFGSAWNHALGNRDSRDIVVRSGMGDVMVYLLLQLKQIVAIRNMRAGTLRYTGHALSLIHISEPTRPY